MLPQFRYTDLKTLVTLSTDGVCVALGCVTCDRLAHHYQSIIVFFLIVDISLIRLMLMDADHQRKINSVLQLCFVYIHFY